MWSISHLSIIDFSPLGDEYPTSSCKLFEWPNAVAFHTITKISEWDVIHIMRAWQYSHLTSFSSRLDGNNQKTNNVTHWAIAWVFCALWHLHTVRYWHRSKLLVAWAPEIFVLYTEHPTILYTYAISVIHFLLETFALSAGCGTSKKYVYQNIFHDE